MTGLGFPGGSSPLPFSGAQAISADGSILAGSASSDEGTNEPIRWENGEFTRLGRIPGYGNNAHQLTGMSADGQRVVGWGYDALGARTQGWLWENGIMIGLGSLAPDPFNEFSSANGISGDGDVVVGSTNSPDGMQAFRWENGMMSALGVLIPTDPIEGLVLQSAAADASYDGNVIVGASRAINYKDYDRVEAFRWSDGVMTGLGDLPGGAFASYASVISSDGSIIFGNGTTDDGERPFIWDAVHGMRDLREVLEGDLGLSLGDWVLNNVGDISQDGSVIVGGGVNPEGNYEAYRIVLPEPATAFLVFVGVAVIHRRRVLRRVSCLNAF